MSPSPREPRADGRRNRAAILDAALGLFAAAPASALDDVARAAGVTRTTLYRHFPRRDELVLALYAKALDEVRDALAGAKLGEGPVLPALERAAATVACHFDAYLVLANGPRTPGVDERLTAAYEAVVAPVVALAARGQASGELSTDVPAWWIADALVGLLLTALERVPDGRVAREDVAALVVPTLWAGVRRGVRPPRSG